MYKSMNDSDNLTPPLPEVQLGMQDPSDFKGFSSYRRSLKASPNAMIAMA